MGNHKKANLHPDFATLTLPCHKKSKLRLLPSTRGGQKKCAGHDPGRFVKTKMDWWFGSFVRSGEGKGSMGGTGFWVTRTGHHFAHPGWEVLKNTLFVGTHISAPHGWDSNCG